MAKSVKPPAKNIKRPDGRSVAVGGKLTAPVKGAQKTAGKSIRGGRV